MESDCAGYREKNLRARLKSDFGLFCFSAFALRLGPRLALLALPLNRALTVASHRPLFPAWLLPIAATTSYIRATFNSLAAAFLPLQEDGKLLRYFHCSTLAHRVSLLPRLTRFSRPSTSKCHFSHHLPKAWCWVPHNNPSLQSSAYSRLTLALIMATVASTASLSDHQDSSQEESYADGLDPSNVFVKYLPAELSDSELTTLFSEHGEVISSKIMLDPLTRKSLGYGYVFRGLEPRFFIGAFLTVSVLASRSL